MPKETHKYSNGEVTVVWKPGVCIHSTLCWKGLIEVFNPRVKPWINMTGADTKRIIEQVRKCPSGALSYYMNENNSSAESEKPLSEQSKITEVIVSANGPYLLKTECLIKHSNGTEEIKKGAVALCRCGGSANKPYCDGTHKKIGFEG